jgi:hypothetical protein
MTPSVTHALSNAERRRTNRWTGATGSDFRIRRDPATLLGTPWPGQLRRYALCLQPRFQPAFEVMRIINLVTIHLWKSRESLYCLIVDATSVDLIRTERSIPRIKVPPIGGSTTNHIPADNPRLVSGIRTSTGDYFEMVSSVDVGKWDSNGSISIYASELNRHHLSEQSLLNGEIELLRYEI